MLDIIFFKNLNSRLIRPLYQNIGALPGSRRQRDNKKKTCLAAGLFLAKMSAAAEAVAIGLTSSVGLEIRNRFRRNLGLLGRLLVILRRIHLGFRRMMVVELLLLP